MSRNRSKISIGIVGCGTIGAELAEWVRTRLKNKARIAALYDLNPSQSKRLKESLSVNAVSVGSLEQLIAESDFVIEAAGVEAVPVVAKKALQKGKDLLIMSVGGLLNHPELMAIAQEHGSKIYVPSGAIGGLDAVKAAALSKITTAISGRPLLERKTRKLGRHSGRNNSL